MLYVVSSDFNTELNLVVIKLYNDETQKLEYYYAEDFLPYFLASETPDIHGITKVEMVTKYDALNDNMIKLVKVCAEDPNVITFMNTRIKKGELDIADMVWENRIKTFQSYIYDSNTKVGMPYHRVGSKLEFSVNPDAEKRVEELIKLINPPDADKEVYEEFARLLEYPAPHFKRVALDIEVMNENAQQVPDPNNANMPVLIVGFKSSEGEKVAFVLIQGDKEPLDLNMDFTKIQFFNDEKELILAVFEYVASHPFLITFNGDDFDLPYLANRSLRLGIPLEQIPISIREQMVFWNNTIHIDLYKFFGVRAMQIYAFAAKYKVISLDAVSKALLGRGKIDGGKQVNDMTYEELITYCLNDAELTLDLTSYNNDLVMNLIIVLSRLSKMPIDNVSRKSISNWIRSMMYYEHRKRNILIPRSEDIVATKGQTATTALIKGKKYQGAIVVDPKAGLHFKAKVGDFASLYPTIMKNYNLGYSTVNCPHEVCKDNKFAGLPHHVCKLNRALESQLIGSLRDLRVFWYKKKAKTDPNEILKAWYKVSEQSIKVFCNASYGVFGDEDFIFYCPPSAEYVTGIGRWIITQTIQKAQEIGLEVLYGDTDSVFIKDPPKAKLDELIAWAKTTFDIEFELDKSYRYVCLSHRKKNYFGVLEDGTVDVKGLTGKKRHTPKIFNDVFNKTKVLLAQVHTEGDMNVTRKEIKTLVKTTYSTLKKRSWGDINDLAFHVSLSKEVGEYDKTLPQHVKAAQQLKDQGYAIGTGSIIDYVKVNHKKVKPASLTKAEEVDVNKYIEFLKNTFIQILEPLGIDWDRDVLGITQLGQWQ